MNDEIVNKFTSHLKNVLTRALCFVVESEQEVIFPKHLLWSLGAQKGCIGAELLKKAKIKTSKLRQMVEVPEKATKKVAAPQGGSPLLSNEAKRVLEKAVLTASIYEHQYIGTEHLLSGVLQIDDFEINQFLKKEEVNVQELREQIAIVLKSTSRFPDLTETLDSMENMTDSVLSQETVIEKKEVVKEKKQGTPILDYFGRELTSPELQKKIDPVIARDEEIQRVMEILSRRTKNNPLLLGEPGVGKTAIVEGLAKQISEGTAPLPLKGKRIVALDLAMLIAGTMYRGEFEGRLRQIIDEVRANDHIILFIDEVHTIIGAGAATGSLDAANILKPALARGEIRCIGATTTAEFKKHIETDAALERRFQTVQVEEPNQEKALLILQGIAPHYENFHGVELDKDTLRAAVELSSRYLQDKHLPDKAIDLIDEASASVRIKNTTNTFLNEKNTIESNLRSVREQKRQAVAEENFPQAIKLKEEEQELLFSLQALKNDTPDKPRTKITKAHIAEIISRMTRIPLHDLLEEEKKQLEKLEMLLRKRVVGQNKAVKSVADAIRRSKTGVSHPDRPLSSFLFLGPSGVGKTELAIVTAETVFGDSKSIIRLNMSEFAEGFTVSKLIGAPAGYVGFREGAKLTDRIKQNPYSVILFDEIEKAHSDVQNLLLQILENGELDDSTGRKVNFKNTVVILTSNVGLEKLAGSTLGFSETQETHILRLNEDLRKELEERFRPELINRIDHVCIFNQLEMNALKKIAKLQLKELAKRLKKQEVGIQIDETALAFLAQAAHGHKLGAREIRRRIQTEVETEIAKLLLNGSPPKNLFVGAHENKLIIRNDE